MPLQNRVAPDGSLHSRSERGMFTGNRGVIHDPGTRALSGRRWTTKAWICCVLDHRGRKRDVWGRNFNGRNGPAAGWSELFFCDEVTALAAGHRPCFACRRDDASRFLAASGIANANSADIALHGERWLSSQQAPQRLSPIDLPGLPDGTMVRAGERFHAIRGRKALAWDFGGYQEPVGFGELLRHPMVLVTPRSVIAALRAGYKPAWHETAMT
ncbi:MAG: hypothetical protein KDJ66_02400 [Nitratireductor sp.]|nr:hypothetical protein [Nitratireductor sp.]